MYNKVQKHIQYSIGYEVFSASFPAVARPTAGSNYPELQICCCVNRLAFLLTLTQFPCLLTHQDGTLHLSYQKSLPNIGHARVLLRSPS